MQPKESKDLERRWRSGEVIVERGSAGRELFIVREGTVLLEDSAGDAVRLLGPGDLFGEVDAILGRAHGSRAVAEGEVVALVLGPVLLNRLCGESPEFCVRLIRHLAQGVERARALGEESGDLLAAQEVERLEAAVAQAPAASGAARGGDLERAFAAALLRLAGGDEPPIPVGGRLAELAAEAGLELLDAYACLQRLLDRQLLRLVDDQLSIVDLDALQTAADG